MKKWCPKLNYSSNQQAPTNHLDKKIVLHAINYWKLCRIIILDSNRKWHLAFTRFGTLLNEIYRYVVFSPVVLHRCMIYFIIMLNEKGVASLVNWYRSCANFMVTIKVTFFGCSYIFKKVGNRPLYCTYIIILLAI